jgi:hypothetical protein
MRVLIVARDSLVATLLATLVDLTGHEATLRAPDEALADALERGQCGGIILDCDHPDAEDVIDQAGRHGARVLLFSPALRPFEMRERSQAYGLQSFTLPVEPGTLRALLEGLVAEWAAARARRFVDSKRRRWYVRELPPTGTPGRKEPTLVFFRPSSGDTTGEHIARRVWRYPENWRDLSDVELESLCEGRPY